MMMSYDSRIMSMICLILNYINRILNIKIFMFFIVLTCFYRFFKSAKKVSALLILNTPQTVVNRCGRKIAFLAESSKLSVSVMPFGGEKLFCKYCLTGEAVQWASCSAIAIVWHGIQLCSSELTLGAI